MANIKTDAEAIEGILTRGTAESITTEELREKLHSGRQLRVKLGIDPTSAHVHLGRTIPLLKLRDFQELGHQVVFIVGDFTGQIGDTSDKDSERPMLTREVIEENKRSYFEQVGKIIDLEQAEFRYNSEWLETLTYREIGMHADMFSVADFIARENIKRRIDAGKRVSLRETLYPLMQGYDSVAVMADVELGGTDQRFNMLAGRTMQPHFGQAPQNILMVPLVNGTDGRKMSSSWGNTIIVDSEPEDMFGKVMSMRDEEIITYFTCCTRLPMAEVADIEYALQNGANPRDAKLKLAHTIVSFYHGIDVAGEAERAFVETFQQGGIPDTVLEVHTPYVEGLLREGVVTSKTELRKLLEAGGVRDAESGKKLTEIPTQVSSPKVLKIGKRRFVRLV